MIPPMNDAQRICPDCGMKNQITANICAECNHPIAPMASEEPAIPPIRRPQRPRQQMPYSSGGKVTQEPGKVIPRRRHSRMGFFGVGGGDKPPVEGSAPGWLWFGIGVIALGIALAAAIGITTQEPPFSVPGASPVQSNTADSLFRALKTDSLNVDGLIRLGNLLYDSQNYERAVEFYRRALAIDPSQTDAHVDLAVSLHQSGHSGEALAELNQVLAEHPDHAIARFDLGVIYEFMGRYEEAEDEYMKVSDLEIQPEMAHAIEQRLRALDQKRQAASGSED